MTTVVEALKELGITEWTLKGNPTNEKEFNANFKKVIGADSNGTAIKSDDPSKFGVTWSQVAAKKKELEDAIEKNREADKIEQDIDRMADDAVVSKLRKRWSRKDVL